MENSTYSRELAVTADPLRADGVRKRYRLPTYLKGYKGLLVLAAATGLLAGWTWFGTAAVLPLLYILPCAAMMAMCMKGHGGAGSSSDKTDAGGNDGAAESS
ncbi:MAG: hypothetical protein ACYCUI_14580 [Vulcanimicrobiaceae bacterium]